MEADISGNEPAPVKVSEDFSISEPGLNLLKSIESLATRPYDDQTGRDISTWVKGATIGYGHLIARSDWDKYKNGISAATAEALFKNDLQPYVDSVNGHVKAQISQQQFDAMVILAFNIGTRGFASSSVLKLVNDPDAHTNYASLEDAWMAWNKSQGKVMRGLTHRRQAEWKIYSEGKYEKW